MMTLDLWIRVETRTVTLLMSLWERERACESLGACALVALERGVAMAEFAWNTPLHEYLRGIAHTPEAPATTPADDDALDIFLALPPSLALRVDNARVTSAIAHLVPRVPPRDSYVAALVAAGARSLSREHAGLPPVVTDLCPEEET